MRKIAVAIRKGGTGKSTSAVHIGHGLAMAGYSVCLIDLDAQGNLATMLGVDYEHTLSDVLEGSVKASESLVKARERLFLLPSDPTLAQAAKVHLSRNFDPQYVLSERIEDLEGMFDYVILDTPPGLTDLTVNAMFYAHEVLAPISLASLSFDALAKTRDEMQAYERRGGASIRYIVPTMLRKQTKMYKDLVPKLQKILGGNVVEGVRDYELFRNLAGSTIYETDPSGKGSYDYAQVTKAVLNG
jgi:chromosome partitioning protein